VSASRFVVGLERLWDSARLRRAADRPPADLRIEAYVAHGGAATVVVRARVVDDPLPSEAVVGEGPVAALRRTLRHFVTDELPGVRLRVRVGDAETTVVSDTEGYVLAHLPATGLTSPWTEGSLELDEPYRGVTAPHTTPVRVRVPGPGARFGVLSDVDDTVIETGVQRLGAMVRRTLTGSALTRTAFPGAPELYRDLAAGADGAETNPVFYVSSSPWNLHAFLVAFLRHRAFPAGPVLLRDLLGTRAGREQKHGRIREVLATHPQLQFVLIGDSGEHDPRIYADVVAEHPDRVLAIYIREVRLDPGDGRVEAVSARWPHPHVPFVLAADSAAVRRHAVSIGLLLSGGEAPVTGP